MEERYEQRHAPTEQIFTFKNAGYSVAVFSPPLWCGKHLPVSSWLIFGTGTPVVRLHSL